MTDAKTCSLAIVWVLCSVLFVGSNFAYCAGGLPKVAPLELEVGGLRGVSAVQGLVRSSLSYCESRLREYVRSPAFVKLALADHLVKWIGNDEECDARGYEWKPGTDDLSFFAGRAKWMLERLLAMKLPGVVDRSSSPEYLRSLREAARLAVEGYRQGIMALAEDYEIPPGEFARLKRKYKGRIPGGPWAEDSVIRPGEIGMDKFLLEWPPVGRQYEDLVSLIGVKGEPEENGVSYTFDWGSTTHKYRFILRDGLIRSVWITGY